MSASPACLRVAACLVAAFFSHAPKAEARESRAPATAGIAAQGTSMTAPDVTGSLAPPREGESEAACTKVRRKMWVEGEGWVVRRVGVCR